MKNVAETFEAAPHLRRVARIYMQLWGKVRYLLKMWGVQCLSQKISVQMIPLSYRPIKLLSKMNNSQYNDNQPLNDGNEVNYRNVDFIKYTSESGKYPV